MTATTPRLKITYATLSADNAELQASYEQAVVWARGELGKSYPMLVGAEERTSEQTFEHRSPIDTDLVVSRFPVGTREDVRDAIAAARAAFPAWRDLGWRKRLEIIRRAADLISERQFEYAALMTFEVGKNRLEALGDVEETADLLRYYGQQMEDHDGFVKPMGSLSPAEHTRSSSSLTACGRSSAPSTSPWPWPAVRPRAPWWRVIPSSSSPAPTPRSWAGSSSRSCARPGSRTAS